MLRIVRASRRRLTGSRGSARLAAREIAPVGWIHGALQVGLRSAPMASAAKRLPANAPGEFFVDSTCIDCDACRWIAPRTFDEHGDQSRVYRQPETAEEERAAELALVACPTGSIGARRTRDLS